MWSKIINYKKKKDSFATALDFLFIKLLTAQNLVFFLMLQRDFLAQKHHWQEQEAPRAVASPGSLMGCIPLGNIIPR